MENSIYPEKWCVCCPTGIYWLCVTCVTLKMMIAWGFFFVLYKGFLGQEYESASSDNVWYLRDAIY